MLYGRPWSSYFGLFIYIIVFIPLFHIFELCRRLADALFPRSHAHDVVDVRRVLWIPYTRVLLPELRALHVHSRYENALDFAWRDPCVHLYGVSEEGATFVRTKGGLEIFDSSTRSFMSDSIHDFAIEFGVVPLPTFQRLVDKAPSLSNARADAAQAAPSSPRVVFVGIQARSGSTLVCQHFEEIDGAVVLNQPKVLLDIFNLVVDDWPSAIDLLQACLLCLAKPLWSGSSVLIIKLGVRETYLLKDVLDARETLPFETAFLFTYRHPIAGVKSSVRTATQLLTDSFGLAGQLPILRRWLPDVITSRGKSFSPIFERGLERLVDDDERWRRSFAWIQKLDFSAKDLEFLTLAGIGGGSSGGGGERVVGLGKTSVSSFFFCWHLCSLLALRELRRKTLYRDAVLPISYEEFVSDPSIWRTRILPFCGLTTATATNGSDALTRDSQRNSPIANEWMKRQHRTSFSKADWDKLDEIVKMAGIAESIFDDIKDYKLF